LQRGHQKGSRAEVKSLRAKQIQAELENPSLEMGALELVDVAQASSEARWTPEQQKQATDAPAKRAVKRKYLQTADLTPVGGDTDRAARLKEEEEVHQQRELNQLTVCEKSLRQHVTKHLTIQTAHVAIWVPSGPNLHRVRERLRACGVPGECIHKNFSSVVQSIANHKLWWTSSMAGSIKLGESFLDAAPVVAGFCARLYGDYLVDEQWLALCISAWHRLFVC
jgi:hypothetical protein